MSATISEASHSASGATDRRLMVQLLLVVRGMLTISNCTLRHSGCRSRAQATRALISSMVAGVLAKSVSKSMSHPLQPRFLGPDFRAALVNGALSRGGFAALAQQT